MLALARAAGEPRRCVYCAVSHYWIAPHGHLDLMQPTASLAVLIYNFAGVPFDNQLEAGVGSSARIGFARVGRKSLGQMLAARRVE